MRTLGLIQRDSVDAPLGRQERDVRAPEIQQASHSIIVPNSEQMARREVSSFSSEGSTGAGESPAFDPFDATDANAEGDVAAAAPEPPHADAMQDAGVPAENVGTSVEEGVAVQEGATAEQIYEESQRAIERELQRRQSAEDFAEELPQSSPFADEEEPSSDGGREQDADQEDTDEIPGPDDDWDPTDEGDRPADVLPDRPDYMEKEDETDSAKKLTPEQEKKRRDQIEEERIQSAKDCRELFEQVRNIRIDSIDLDIRIEGEPGEDFPFDCGLGDELFAGRSWNQVTYLWKASGLCHKPLYFEQVQLERYGHCWGPYVQPIMSGAHFFCSVPILPYKMGIQTPNECVYSLGYYRPGSCAPYMIEAVPFTLRAALFQGGVATALPFIIP